MTLSRSIAAALVSASGVASAELPDVAKPEPPAMAKPVAAGAVAALYGGYATWAYLAWYRDAASGSFHGEPGTGFRLTSYAGGADKVGHFWATYSLARATTGLLTEAGWDRRGSSFVGAGLSELTFILTEIEDGYTVGFDSQDLIANTLGAGFALLLDNVPAIDRMFDVRLEYFPSRQYRRNLREAGSLDVGQDYTGQSYMLAYHLDTIPWIEEQPATRWLAYVDVVLGFETRNFSPVPDPPAEPPRQVLYAGVSINMQHVLSSLFCNSLGRRIGSGIFEVASIPYTTLPLEVASRARVNTP